MAAWSQVVSYVATCCPWWDGQGECAVCDLHFLFRWSCGCRPLCESVIWLECGCDVFCWCGAEEVTCSFIVHVVDLEPAFGPGPRVLVAALAVGL